MKQKTLPLTVIIVAKNEAENLITLLPTLYFAKEIIIIDDASADDTAEIAEKYKAKVLHYNSGSHFAAARNWALSQATYEWVLYIDADEQLDAQAVASLQEIFSQPISAKGFAFKRQDYLWDKEVKYGEVKHAIITRLGPKSSPTWEGAVHEVWHLHNPELVEGKLLHNSHHSFFTSIKKINRYAKLESASRSERGMRWTWLEVTSYPMAKFFQNFILRSGWRDGKRGLYYALLMTFHSALVRFYQLKASIKLRPENPLVTLIAQMMVLLAVAAVPFGQLLRFQLTAGIAVYAFEIFMVMAVIAWMAILIKKVRLPTSAPWTVSLLVFSLVMGISLLANANHLQASLLPAALYWWRWLLYVTFGWLLWDGLATHWLSFSWRKAIEYFGFVYLVFGWLQYLFMPDMRWLLAYGWDDHYYRMIGSLFDPNFLGLLIVLLGIYVVTFGKTLKQVIGAMIMISLGLTYSRSSYAAFLAFVMASIVKVRYFKQSLIYTVILCISLFAFSNLIKPGGEGVNLARTYSIVHRARSIVTGWDIFREHPSIGIGYNAYRTYTQPEAHDQAIPYHPSSPDNSFMLVLATTGILGMVSFGYFLFCFVLSARKHPFQLMSLAAILAHSLFNNSFFYPFVLLWWLIITLELVPKKK